MTEGITAAQFHDAEGVDEWRALGVGIAAHFTTGSFAEGVALVDEIGRLADAADHHPDVDLRYAHVTVRMVTHDVGGLSGRDVALARQISDAARALGIRADVTRIQDVHVTIDARTTAEVRPFWQAVLGYREDGDDELVDPLGRGPAIWFQPMDPPRADRSRTHLDVWVPHDQAEARIAAAIAAGGRRLSDEHAPAWWTLADPEGNEVDIATWRGRG